MLYSPRLEAVQYLDFTVSRALPWQSLIEKIREVEPDSESEDAWKRPDESGSVPPSEDIYANAILAYLDQRGLQMASFDRLRGVIDNNLTNEKFNEIILRNRGVFRHATLKGKRPGMAKLIP